MADQHRRDGSTSASLDPLRITLLAEWRKNAASATLLAARERHSLAVAAAAKAASEVAALTATFVMSVHIKSGFDLRRGRDSKREPRAYAVVRTAALTFVSDVVGATSHPVWDEKYIFDGTGATDLTVEVCDVRTGCCRCCRRQLGAVKLSAALLASLRPDGRPLRFHNQRLRGGAGGGCVNFDVRLVPQASTLATTAETKARCAAVDVAEVHVRQTAAALQHAQTAAAAAANALALARRASEAFMASEVAVTARLAERAEVAAQVAEATGDDRAAVAAAGLRASQDARAMLEAEAAEAEAEAREARHAELVNVLGLAKRERQPSARSGISVRQAAKEADASADVVLGARNQPRMFTPPQPAPVAAAASSSVDTRLPFRGNVNGPARATDPIGLKPLGPVPSGPASSGPAPGVLALEATTYVL